MNITTKMASMSIDTKNASVTVDRAVKGKVLLYVATFGFSHMQYAFTIGEWLIEDGFEVHLLVVKTKPNEVITFPEWVTKKHIVEPAKTDEEMVKRLLKRLTSGANNFYTSGLFSELISSLKDTNRTLLTHPCMDDIRNEKYDMLIGEIFSPIVILKLRDMGIPKFIYISALPFDHVTADKMGLPSPTSYLPIMNECVLCGDEMGFFDRARNMYTALYIRLCLQPKIMEKEKDLMTAFGYDADAAFIRASQSYDLRVFNSNILLDYPRPTLHNVLHVGGSMTKEPKALEEPVASVFAKPSDGVILISFGTLAESSNFPKIFLPSIRAVMEALPSYEFIFRVGNVAEHTEAAKLPNVTVLDWVDQVSILANPKTKLFYTHCGLNSLNESLFFGVPMVASPVFGDQFYNATLLRKKKVGQLVELKTITPAKLIAAFKTVLEDPVYATEARHIALKTKDLPVQPKKTFLRWANYIHKHGAKQDFTLKSVELSFVKLHSLDVIFVAIVALLIGVFTLSKVHSILFGVA